MALLPRIWLCAAGKQVVSPLPILWNRDAAGCAPDKTRSALRGGLFLALLASVVLCGCHPAEKEKDKLLGESPIKPLVLGDFSHPLIDSNTGNPLPITPSASMPKLSFTDAVPGQNSPISAGSLEGGIPGVNDGSRDYTAKADIYWRLNWIRKEILAGRVPSDLDHILARIRAEMQTTRPDGNYEVTSAALTHLEKGLAHLKANETILAAGVNPAVVPWNGGREAMRQFIAQIGIGPGFRTDVGPADPVAEAAPESRNADAALKAKETGGSEHTAVNTAPSHKSAFSAAARSLMDDELDDDAFSSGHSDLLSDTPLTAEQRKIVDLLMTYATHYNNSPEQMMRQEWRLAIEKINKLRDQLALAHRSENDDGDNTQVFSASRTGPAASIDGQIDKVFPNTFLPDKGSVAPSDDATPDVPVGP